MSDAQLYELRGLAKGILCDGQVSPAEVAALRQWLVSNSSVTELPAADALMDTVLRVFDDRTVDGAECEEIKRSLSALITEIERQSRWAAKLPGRSIIQPSSDPDEDLPF